MADKKRNPIKQEADIPKDVMEKLRENRTHILTHRIKQEKKKFHIKYKKQLIATLAIAATCILIALINPQINTAIKQALGISKDSGVATVEEKGIQSELNVTSTQNGREITLTKFVSTKKKMAFDYQFKLDDEKLKELIRKQSSPDRVFKKATPNDPNAPMPQDIELGLFVNGEQENLFGGVIFESTYRVEEDMFYGSVIAIFNQEKIPEDAKLALHIYKLAWSDAEELDQAFLEASPTGSSFGVENALEYVGDWQFDIVYQPLTQTAETKISNVSNITNIKASNDALQTTVTFTASFPEETFPAVMLYKNGVKAENQMLATEFNGTIITFSFDLSALDKTSVYTVQLNEINDAGEPLKEIGHFDIQNK